PYAKCPSDPFPAVIQVNVGDPGTPWAAGGPLATTNYAGNNGTMRMDGFGGCLQFNVQLRPLLNIKVYPEINAVVPMANLWGDCAGSMDCSGIMGNAGYGARIADIRDGTSQVFCVGEILPECTNFVKSYGGDMWSYGRLSNNSHTNAPINFDTCPPHDAANPCDSIDQLPV